MIEALQASSRNTAIKFYSFIYTFRVSVRVYCWSSLITNKFIYKYYMLGWNLSRKGFIVSAVTNMWYAIRMGVLLSMSVLLGDSVCWNSLMYYKWTKQSSIMMLEYVLVVEKKYHQQSIINYYFQNQTPQFLISSSISLPTWCCLLKRISRNRDQMLWVTYRHPQVLSMLQN